MTSKLSFRPAAESKAVLTLPLCRRGGHAIRVAGSKEKDWSRYEKEDWPWYVPWASGASSLLIRELCVGRSTVMTRTTSAFQSRTRSSCQKAEVGGYMRRTSS